LPFSAYSSTLSLSLGGYVENNEFQGMWKEEAVVGFEILSLSYSVGTEEHHDESVETLKVKVKAIPLHAWAVLEESRSLRLKRFQDNRHMNVIRLSALSTGHLYSKKYSWYSFLLEVVSTPWP